jgi:tetratricopeptide (TPR) repeat protein
VNPHPDRLTILLYVENASGMDRPAIGAHLADCSACTAVMEDCQQMILLLSGGDLLSYLAAGDPHRDDLRAMLMRECDTVGEERSSAEAFFNDLQRLPLDLWANALAERPEQRTYQMARRIFEEVEVELNRRPHHALLLIALAERIGSELADVPCRTIFGDAWKHRSNAFRHLGRYGEALDAAEMAEAFYASLTAGAFDVAQAQYTRAAVLFKMTRFREALDTLNVSSTTLRDFGESLPLAKTMMLAAAILLDQGDALAARERWRDVMPILERLGQNVELARVLANLAECNLRLGRLDEAEHDAREAMHRYRELRMDAEAMRSGWTLGMVALARGAYEEGLSALESTAASFEARGMAGDAGFVKLDICEELLRRGEWKDAAVIARELIRLFTAARVTLASIQALDYLRRAVERHEATTAVVESVREFVMVDDAARTFTPPA